MEPDSIILYTIKGEHGFLKGNATAVWLTWNKTPYKSSMYKHKESALKIIEKLANRKYPHTNVELYEIEIILHGTISEILEKELL